MYATPGDAHYLLRPEAIESVFYMHYFTCACSYCVEQRAGVLLPSE